MTELDNIAIKTSRNGFQYVVIPKEFNVYRGQKGSCQTIGSGYASDIETAKIYMDDDKPPCCYEFIKPAKLFYMDETNVARLIEFIKTGSSIGTFNPTEEGYLPLIEILENHFLSRMSAMDVDAAALKALCATFFKERYDGYYAPERDWDHPRYGPSTFHRELALCKPWEFLVQCFKKQPVRAVVASARAAKSDKYIQKRVKGERDTGKETRGRLSRTVQPYIRRPVSVRPNTYPSGVHNIHVLCENVPKMTREEAMEAGITDDEDYLDYLKQYATCVENMSF